MFGCGEGWAHTFFWQQQSDCVQWWPDMLNSACLPRFLSQLPTVFCLLYILSSLSGSPGTEMVGRLSCVYWDMLACSPWLFLSSRNRGTIHTHLHLASRNLCAATLASCFIHLHFSIWIWRRVGMGVGEGALGLQCWLVELVVCDGLCHWLSVEIQLQNIVILTCFVLGWILFFLF